MAKEDYSQTGLTVQQAIQTLLDNDLTELFAAKTELENARDGESTLLDKINSLDAAVNGSAIKTAYEAEANTNAFTDAEKTKLDGIADNATADQTGAEIKSLYEAQSNTNAFTDTLKNKLDGIADNATADQTGAEIKAAYEAEANTNAFTDDEKTKLAGAPASTDTDVSGKAWVLDEDTMSSDSATKLPTQQSVKAYVDTEVAKAREISVNSIGQTASNQTLDLSSYEIFEVEPTGAIEISVNGLSSTKRRKAQLHLTNGGEQAVTFGSNIKWAGGTAPTFSTASGWGDVNNLSDDSHSYNITLSFPQAIVINPDGYGFYIADSNLSSYSNVYQYAMTNQWDLTSVSGVTNISILQDTNLAGIHFGNSGGKLYCLGRANDTVYQYDLSTPWALSTATYSTKSFSVASETTDPIGLAFNSDGSKMYVVDSSDTVFQYSVTSWDISTASYDSISFSASSQFSSTYPQNITFNSSGTRFYLTGASVSGGVYQYNLSTAWDLSTAAYSGYSKSIEYCYDIGFRPDGTKAFVFTDSGTVEKISKYSLTDGNTTDIISLQQHGTDTVLATITHENCF